MTKKSTTAVEECAHDDPVYSVARRRGRYRWAVWHAPGALWAGCDSGVKGGRITFEEALLRARAPIASGIAPTSAVAAGAALTVAPHARRVAAAYAAHVTWMVNTRRKVLEDAAVIASAVERTASLLPRFNAAATLAAAFRDDSSATPHYWQIRRDLCAHLAGHDRPTCRAKRSVSEEVIVGVALRLLSGRAEMDAEIGDVDPSLDALLARAGMSVARPMVSRESERSR